VTTWMKQRSEYYGFYSNVNPNPTNSTFRDNPPSAAWRIPQSQDRSPS